MLHGNTQILTTEGFVALKNLKINDTLKTYFGTTRINKIDQRRTNLLKVQCGPTVICCSPDQTFMVKTNSGYNFAIPKVGDYIVKYAVNAASVDMLMTLELVDSVTLWGTEDLYRLHLDDDFILIIESYLLVRS